MPDVFQLGPVPTNAEIDSFVRGYSEAPWREQNEPERIREYLASYRQAGAIALGIREPDHDPYLYTHFRIYDDVDKLIEDEFTGPDAFYTTTEQEIVRIALGNQ